MFIAITDFAMETDFKRFVIVAADNGIKFIYISLFMVIFTGFSYESGNRKITLN